MSMLMKLAGSVAGYKMYIAVAVAAFLVGAGGGSCTMSKIKNIEIEKGKVEIEKLGAKVERLENENKSIKDALAGCDLEKKTIIDSCDTRAEKYRVMVERLRKICFAENGNGGEHETIGDTGNSTINNLLNSMFPVQK